MDPFAEVPTLNILCSYYDSTGHPLASSPEHILRQAEASFKKYTEIEFKCLGELEYYIISKEETFYHRNNGSGIMNQPHSADSARCGPKPCS